MSKGTIVYVGHFELPDKNAAAHRVVTIGKIFYQIGYNVAYLGTVRGAKYFDGIRQSDFDENVYEESYPNSTKKWVKSIFDTKNIKTVVDKYNDVKMIILYNVPYATLKAVRRAFKGSGIKIVYDCTEWNSYAEGNILKRWYKKFDEFQVRNFIAKKTDGLIIISSIMNDKYKKGNDSILLLPPMVDLDDKIWHQDRLTHDDTFEFCYAGAVGNKEKLDCIIDAFNLLDKPKAMLRVIGNDKESFLKLYPGYETVVNDSNITFMGRLSHEDTVKYVLSCDCYIFIREFTRRNNAGFPTKFVEAYTCGIPIITTNVSDVKKYAGITDRVQLLDGTETDGIYNAMKNALTKDNLDKQLDNTFDIKNYIDKSKDWITFAE